MSNNEVKKELAVANSSANANAASAPTKALEATTQKMANALDLSGTISAAKAANANTANAASTAKKLAKPAAKKNIVKIAKKAEAKTEAKAALKPAAKAATSKTTDLNKQLADFAQANYASNTALAKQLMAARNINQVFELQSKAARENLQNGLQQAMQINKIFADALSQAFKFGSSEK